MRDTTKTKPRIESVQSWPGGKLLYYSGDPHGDTLRMHRGYSKYRGRKPTVEERKAIQVELYVKRIIDEDIYCLDSMLVSELMKGDGLDGEFSYENVSNLRTDPSDWTLRQCSEFLEDNGVTSDPPEPNPFAMSRQALLDFADAEDSSRDLGALTDEELKNLVISDIDEGSGDYLKDWRDAVRDNAQEAEIYEFYRVSDWLARHLDEIGECVLDNAYGFWFCRCCTGQSIEMDGTFQRIAANCLKQ